MGSVAYAPADELGVDAGHLDFSLWNYQRGQGQSRLVEATDGRRSPFSAAETTVRAS
jgi:hypothetical protein